MLMLARAEVEIAENSDDVRRFLEENQDSTVALFFIDSSLNEGSQGGFFSGIVTSVSHIFSGEEGAGGQQTKVADIEKEIADDADLMKIDVNNENLRDIEEAYDVTTVPFLMVFKKGVVVLKEVPTQETHDKLLQILNINPASVNHDEAAPATEETPAPAATPEPTPVATPEPTPAQPEVKVTVAPNATPVIEATPITADTTATTGSSIDQIPARQVNAPQQVPLLEPEKAQGAKFDDLREPRKVPASAPIVIVKPVDDEPIPEPEPATPAVDENRQITLAPGEKPPTREKQVQERPKTNPDERRQFVHHQCHDVTTYNDNEVAHWRDSPFYITELEDYQIPEDWWRNGYSPIDRSDAEQPKEPETRAVAFSEPEVIVYEPSAPPAVFIPPPVRFMPEPRVAPVVRETREPRFVAPRYTGRQHAVNETVTAGPVRQTHTRPVQREQVRVAPRAEAQIVRQAPATVSTTQNTKTGPVQSLGSKLVNVHEVSTPGPRNSHQPRPASQTTVAPQNAQRQSGRR